MGERRRRRRLRRRIGYGVVTVLVLTVLAGGWLGWRANQARQELNRAQVLLPTLRTQLASQDLAGAEATAVQLSGHTSEARRLTGDPIWQVAGAVPFLGNTPRTVTTLSAAADDVSRGVVLPLLDEADALDEDLLSPSSGRFDLALIGSKSATVTQVSERLTGIVSAVEDTADSGVLGPVATARDSLLSQLRDADDQMSALDAALQLMPGMLGASEPRTYLVLFQNNAEVRALGGMPGAFAVVRADGGALTLVSQGGPGDLGRFDEPTSPLPEGMIRMFGDEPGVYFQNVNFTPNWTWAAGRYREMYTAKTGQQLDGVIAADPVVASYLIPGDASVRVNGRELTSDQLVPYLLNQVYRDLPGQNSAQNAVYEVAAADTFDRLTSGSTDPTTVITGLSRGAEEGRLMVWSARSDEQAILSGTALDGPLRPAGTGGDAPGSGPASPVIGVFYNAAIPSKMDYYLRQDVSLSAPVCTSGERNRHTLTVTLENAAPSDAGTSLPVDIVGPADYITPGQNRVQVLVYVPENLALGQMVENGAPANYGSAKDAGWRTVLMVTTIDPQGRSTVALDVEIPRELAGTPVIRTTPTISAPSVTVSEQGIGPNGGTPPRNLPHCVP